jgi:hypothetical protein
MNEIVNDISQVEGHIYLITNTTTNTYYVGQTLSHRKNHNKYRPFGFMGRFKDHLSEAICNTKKKQCTYLNNAIRMYGKEAFQCELLMICPRVDLDNQEIYHIKKYNSLYPNGYNLTYGGKTCKKIKTVIENTCPINTPKKRGGCMSRSKETREKMTNRLKEVMGTPEAREKQMRRSQEQHSTMKLSKFIGVNIDMNQIDEYIRVINKKDGSQFIRLVIGDKVTQFTGKYETLEELKKKATEFIKSIKNSATLPNCSGNP